MSLSVNINPVSTLSFLFELTLSSKYHSQNLDMKENNQVTAGYFLNKALNLNINMQFDGNVSFYCSRIHLRQQVQLRGATDVLDETGYRYK